MSEGLAQRLRALAIEIEPLEPMADWHQTAAVDADGLVHVSGQLPLGRDGLAARGRLESEDDVERGRACAKLCMAHVLAQLERAAGGLDRVVGVPKVTVFVASGESFGQQSRVADAASELLHAVLGDAGRHARSAIGVSALPFGAPVEIEAVARLANGGAAA